MPGSLRASATITCYHVLNRGNARGTVFHTDEDYAAFLKLLAEASERVPMRLLSYCLMPNHFHLVVWTHREGDLSRWMQWLTTTHVRRYHRHYQSRTSLSEITSQSHTTHQNCVDKSGRC